VTIEFDADEGSEFAEKNFGFITSAGRTGTKFFGDFLGQMIFDCFSIHEPDVIVDFKFSLRQLRQFGFYQLIFGKILGKTGIRNLSQRFLSGEVNLWDLEDLLVKHRGRYYRDIEEKLIVESYSGWYGVIPAIRDLYKNYKIIIIVRDPRDWVFSNMNWGTMYGRRDWVSRLDPKLVGDTDYEDEWQVFTQFQKLCWAWATIYRILERDAAGDSNIRFFKFEALFKSKDKYDYLSSLLNFVTRFDNRNFGFHIPEGILDKRVNKTVSFKFPKWNNWTPDMKKDLKRICGGVADRCEYDLCEA
jgi:hypothetical protein